MRAYIGENFEKNSIQTTVKREVGWILQAWDGDVIFNLNFLEQSYQVPFELWQAAVFFIYFVKLNNSFLL